MTLSAPKNQIHSDNLKAQLATKIIGRNIHCFENVESTNTVAKTMAEKGAEDGTVIVAYTQNAGYGRLNRNWTSPVGGLWLSVILRPESKPADCANITLMTGVAVAQTLANYNLAARIKWPNDMLVNGKKICGILTEGRTLNSKMDYVIVGIGINANFEIDELPGEIKTNATTMKHETGRETHLEGLLKNLLSEMDKWNGIQKSDESNKIIRTWRELSDTLGKKVKCETHQKSIEGLAMDIDENGALLVKTINGDIQKIVAGDCVHVSKN